MKEKWSQTAGPEQSNAFIHFLALKAWLNVVFIRFSWVYVDILNFLPKIKFTDGVLLVYFFLFFSWTAKEQNKKRRKWCGKYDNEQSFQKGSVRTRQHCGPEQSRTFRILWEFFKISHRCNIPKECCLVWVKYRSLSRHEVYVSYRLCKPVGIFQKPHCQYLSNAFFYISWHSVTVCFEPTCSWDIFAHLVILLWTVVNSLPVMSALW